MTPPISVEARSVDERKRRLFVEGTLVEGERRSGFLVVVGDEYVVMDTEAAGDGLRYLVGLVSGTVGPPSRGPDPVATSHRADVPGETPMSVYWSFDPALRPRLVAVVREGLGGAGEPEGGVGRYAGRESVEGAP